MLEQRKNAAGILGGQGAPLRIPPSEREPGADQILTQNGIPFPYIPMRLLTVKKVVANITIVKWGMKDESFRLHSEYKLQVMRGTHPTSEL